MMDAPLVSIVIPTYNRAELLPRTLASVAAQTYRPIETVVVDDNSIDDTDAAIERGARDLERAGIALHSKRLVANRGPSAARNVGIGMSTGALVAFLDSDDLWRPLFVAKLVDVLSRRPDCGVCFSGNVGIDINDKVTGINRFELGDEPEGQLRTPFEAFVRDLTLFCTSSVLVRRSALDEVGWFDETLRQSEDNDLFFRLAKRFDFAYTTAPLLCARYHRGNTSNTELLDRYASKSRVLARHLGDVREPLSRRFGVAHIQRSQVLLQEQLLREARPPDEYRTLLYNEYSPNSVRFRIGRFALKGPTPIGRIYAVAIRMAGEVRRRI
jgi:glycosyltransferase involved in cell wall biosynthesis